MPKSPTSPHKSTKSPKKSPISPAGVIVASNTSSQRCGRTPPPTPLPLLLSLPPPPHYWIDPLWIHSNYSHHLSAQLLHLQQPPSPVHADRNNGKMIVWTFFNHMRQEVQKVIQVTKTAQGRTGFWFSITCWGDSAHVGVTGCCSFIFFSLALPPSSRHLCLRVFASSRKVVPSSASIIFTEFLDEPPATSWPLEAIRQCDDTCVHECSRVAMCVHVCACVCTWTHVGACAKRGHKPYDSCKEGFVPTLLGCRADDLAIALRFHTAYGNKSQTCLCLDIYSSTHPFIAVF